jgi:DNA-binding transcriptional LysR family regulator
MVTFEHTLPVARRIRRYLRQNGVNPVISSAFDNIDTIKSAVTVTDDIAILPKPTVMREKTAGSLVVIDLEPPFVRPMGIIYRRTPSAGFRPAVQAFVDFLLDHAKVVQNKTMSDNVGKPAPATPRLVGDPV